MAEERPVEFHARNERAGRGEASQPAEDEETEAQGRGCEAECQSGCAAEAERRVR